METVTLIAPSVWASAIVNGDDSGIGQEDKEAIAAFLSREGVKAKDCLDVRSYGFAWKHDAFPEMPLGAECAEYVFRI